MTKVGEVYKCKKCGNEWQYNGSNPYYATCTRCLNKVKVEQIKEVDDDRT